MIDFDRFKDYMRPHTAAETAALEESLLANGCREPLTVAVLAGDRCLADGFNRKALCDRHGIAYQFVEVEFPDPPAVYAWMERNARGRRNQTRTERNYYIGCRYEREKGPLGGASYPKKSGGKKVATDSTAAAIAESERCSHQHVKNCHKLAGVINGLGERGLGFLKWPLLMERLKYSKKLIDAIEESGTVGVEAVKELLATHEAVTARMIRDAIGAEEADEPPEINKILRLTHDIGERLTTRGQYEQLVMTLRSLASHYERTMKEATP